MSLARTIFKKNLFEFVCTIFKGFHFEYLLAQVSRISFRIFASTSFEGFLFEYLLAQLLKDFPFESFVGTSFEGFLYKYLLLRVSKNFFWNPLFAKFSKDLFA